MHSKARAATVLGNHARSSFPHPFRELIQRPFRGSIRCLFRGPTRCLFRELLPFPIRGDLLFAHAEERAVLDDCRALRKDRSLRVRAAFRKHPKASLSALTNQNARSRTPRRSFVPWDWYRRSTFPDRSAPVFRLRVGKYRIRQRTGAQSMPQPTKPRSIFSFFCNSVKACGKDEPVLLYSFPKFHHRSWKESSMTSHSADDSYQSTVIPPSSSIFRKPSRASARYRRTVDSLTPSMVAMFATRSA